MIENLSKKEYADLIRKAIDFLKEKKINQGSVEEKINYYSLSKAKNSLKYSQKTIEGKDRREVLYKIIDAYHIQYNPETNSFEATKGHFDKTSYTEPDIYYVLYYFSLAKQVVGKGLVTIREKKWATIDFCDPNHTFSLWQGNFEVIENFTFLNVEKKGNTTPLKALYSLFSGTIKLGRPILIGTYSTIKRDGSPTAGNVVMEKVKTKEDGLAKVNGATNPKITAFLLDKNLTLKTLTPPTIDNLPKPLIVQSYVGDFLFYWPYKMNRILSGKLTINENTEAIASFERMLFKGRVSLSDHNTLYLNLRNSIIKGNSKSNNIHVYLNINNYNDADGAIAGVVVTPSLFVSPTAFPILILRNRINIKPETIENYFNSISGPLLFSSEPLELKAILEKLERSNS